MASRPVSRSLLAMNLIGAQIDPVDDDLQEFFERMSRSVASLVSARRAGFFLLEGDVISLQDGAFGFEPEVQAALSGLPCREGAGELADRIVFNGHVFRADIDRDDPQMQPYSAALEALGARTAVAVPWAMGSTRLGLIAAYDSSDPQGFSEEDVWVLQVAAATAVMVWQQRSLARRLVGTKAAEAEQMRAVADRMTELEEMKRHILNLAAHELRGPLAVIRGYLSMVSEGQIDAAGLKRVLPILNGKAAQMDALITQMLDIARLEEGRLEVRSDVIDVGLVVRETIDVAALLAPPGVTVFFGQPRRPLRVRGDATRIATIVSNLVDNAIKYSPGGGTVTCEIAVEGPAVRISVTDEGLGIADEHLPVLFSRFGRIVTPENRHIGGTGLGLHLGRELARLQGGDISVESRLGVGSRFTLTLPLA